MNYVTWQVALLFSVTFTCLVIFIISRLWYSYYNNKNDATSADIADNIFCFNLVILPVVFVIGIFTFYLAIDKYENNKAQIQYQECKTEVFKYFNENIDTLYINIYNDETQLFVNPVFIEPSIIECNGKTYFLNGTLEKISVNYLDNYPYKLDLIKRVLCQLRNK